MNCPNRTHRLDRIRGGEADTGPCRRGSAVSALREWRSLLHEALERLFDCGGLEPERARRALVGDAAVAIDDVEAVRPRGIGALDAVVGIVDERRQLDAQLGEADAGDLGGLLFRRRRL